MRFSGLMLATWTQVILWNTLDILEAAYWYSLIDSGSSMFPEFDMKFFTAISDDSFSGSISRFSGSQVLHPLLPEAWASSKVLKTIKFSFLIVPTWGQVLL